MVGDLQQVKARFHFFHGAACLIQDLCLNAFQKCLPNINIVAVATLVDFACIVVAEGAEIGEDVREAARAKGVNLLASPRPAFELCAALAGEADK